MIARLALALLVLACSACSSFNRDWEAAAGSSTATRWDGRWTSAQHKAHGGGPAGGRLRAIFEPTPEGRLAGRFRANWLAFVSSYAMTLEPVASPPRRKGARHFRGTHTLSPLFGGVYRYEAILAGDHFTARYHSSYDVGTFELERLRVANDCFPPHARH